MIAHTPALVIVVPLLSALVVVIVGWYNRTYCFPVSVASLGVSLVSSILLLGRVMQEKLVIYTLAGWAPPMGIEYRIDTLSGLVLVVVTAVGFLNLIGNKPAVDREFGTKAPAFYALYILFVAGLVGMVATGDAFNLYVLLEIASLTGYALLGLGSPRSALSALNYLFMGTIGASFYLLGVGYLYLQTGTLNMADIARFIPHVAGSGTVLLALIVCLTGLFLKMALFPLHGWLPNAYAHAPNPAIGVVAALTTKVSIYVMVRVVLYVFTPDYVFAFPALQKAIVWVAVIAIFMGGILALSQTRIKQMLTYIIIAEVGYMVGGFWLGNRLGMTGSILHIVNDAAMTLAAFMGAGLIAYQLETDRYDGLQGLFKKMPYTMIGIVIAGMSMIGVPPTCGFFSKWYLISGGIAAGHYLFVAVLLFSSLVNAVLFFRIFEIAHYEPFDDGNHGHGGGHGHGGTAVPMAEAPVSMVAVFLMVSAGLVILGLFSGTLVEHLITFAIPAQIGS
ncbi:MAG: proton-conducting membrane transporter [Deltaproteobacteria bacterium]|nr:MAG: proton-conducting membrane transporter [Deltaproteobacteria bacterium]